MNVIRILILKLFYFSIPIKSGWRILFLSFAFIFLDGISYAQQWEYTYGGAGRQSGFKMLETYDNGFAILGLTGPIGSDRIFLIKTDINGNVLWTKTIGSSLYFNGVFSSLDVTNGQF